MAFEKELDTEIEKLQDRFRGIPMEQWPHNDNKLLEIFAEAVKMRAAQKNYHQYHDRKDWEIAVEYEKSVDQLISLYLKAHEDIQLALSL